MTILFTVAENIRKADPRLTRKEAIAKAIELYDAIGPQPLPERPERRSERDEP
jgi:hypothetical protein